MATERFAYWLHPDGEDQIVETTHVAAVIAAPERFGLTAKRILSCYRAHGEESGTEGYAREELLLDIIARGWIRIRFYARTCSWTINARALDRETGARLPRWAADRFGRGELDPTDRIVIDLPDRRIEGSMADVITEWTRPGLSDPRQGR